MFTSFSVRSALYVSAIVVLAASLCLIHTAAADSYEIDDAEVVPSNYEPASPAQDYATALKRAIYKKTRTMKKCGGGKLCPAEATCCGTKQCCRKPWTCRYMARFSQFYCIP